MKEPLLMVNFEELRAFAAKFARGLRPHENSATVVALYGDLGSGKTTFTQAAARALGVAETVISPTFVLERVYRLKDQKFEHLIHIDCYRIGASKEIALLGWDEKCANPRNLIFVEWAERMEELLPPNTIRIYFEFADETTRKIKISNEIQNGYV